MAQARFEICHGKRCSGGVFDEGDMFDFGIWPSHVALETWNHPIELVLGWDPADSELVCTGDKFHVVLQDRMGNTLFERHNRVRSYRPMGAMFRTTRARLGGSILQVCRGSTCLDTTVVVAGGAFIGHLGAAGMKADGATVIVQLSDARASPVSDVDEQLTLDVRYYAAARTTLCIGDAFSVALKDGMGESIFERRYRVKSQSTFPINGPGCPPTCRVAEMASYDPLAWWRKGCQR